MVLSLYPELFPGPLGAWLAGKALGESKCHIDAVQIRDFAEGRHRMVDDTPSGGGAGLVMKPDVIARPRDSVADGHRPMR
ncbi:tRNA (guanosine(37)-N1)-methyltransferase TrmD, partial [Brucella oryzae]